MKKTNFQPAELCALIKVCGESGVQELKFADVHVTFGRTAEASPDLTAITPEQASSAGITEKLNKDVLELEDLRAREDELALMRVENPERYEDLLAEGELEDARAGSA